MPKPLISIVSPVYKGEELVDELVHRIVEAVSKISLDFEIILVDDGSPDRSWEAIERHAKTDQRVRGVKLSRNFGQHRAVIAGVHHACGNTVVIIDCDLQDDPMDIIQLYEQHEQGYEVVFTLRKNRKHSVFKIVASKIYNFLFQVVSDEYYDVDVGSLLLFSAKVREAFIGLRDDDYVQMLKWLGYKTIYFPVDHHERFAGESTYTWDKLISMALQGWVSHSTKLLRVTVAIGMIVSISATVGAIYLLLGRFYAQEMYSGFIYLGVVMLFSTGLILTSIGIASLYIGKIFMQTKNRPLFVVDKTQNSNHKPMTD
jgi:polyisoprenyl-phosphate glycosyltransferase